MLPQVRWKIATFAPEYAGGNAKVNVLKWSYRNGGKKKKRRNKVFFQKLILVFSSPHLGEE